MIDPEIIRKRMAGPPGPDAGEELEMSRPDMEPFSPLYTADLFPPLHDEFVDLLRGAVPEPAVTVRADPDTAWRLLYNALSPAVAREKVSIQGDPALAGPLLSTRSVMV
jgi:hypothetical protein